MKFSIIFIILALLWGKEPKGPPDRQAGKDQVITIHTDFGDITLLLSDKTPKHKANFLKLAKEGFYDGVTFHRIIDNFMIQGGDPNTKDDDPTNDGLGDPGYTIPSEFVEELTHNKGVIAAARESDRVNPNKASSGSQFYIVENKKGYHSLDGNYTVFGEVIKGFEVVEKIAEQKKDNRNKPLEEIKMTITVKKMSRKKIQKLYGYTY
ncbi:MAG: peptidylprolyl isomerase [Cyclobacteriaceae bacterium]|nr:peptidylprolyl isomerase [Cyclobacteriaceae bacterium]